jgi:hypothetical protein
MGEHGHIPRVASFTTGVNHPLAVVAIAIAELHTPQSHDSSESDQDGKCFPRIRGADLDIAVGDAFIMHKLECDQQLL